MNKSEYVISRRRQIGRRNDDLSSISINTVDIANQKLKEKTNKKKQFLDLYLHCRKSHDGNKICVVPTVIAQLDTAAWIR